MQDWSSLCFTWTCKLDAPPLEKGCLQLWAMSSRCPCHFSGILLWWKPTSSLSQFSLFQLRSIQAHKSIWHIRPQSRHNAISRRLRSHHDMYPMIRMLPGQHSQCSHGKIQRSLFHRNHKLECWGKVPMQSFTSTISISPSPVLSLRYLSKGGRKGPGMVPLIVATGTPKLANDDKCS